MRPRGLSSSSPSRRKVGQVAVHMPQCTQVRSTLLELAVSGSRSCSAVKLVCMNRLPESARRQRTELPHGDEQGGDGDKEKDQRYPGVAMTQGVKHDRHDHKEGKHGDLELSGLEH